MRLIDADAFREQIFSYYACVNEDTSKSNYKGETLMAYEVADMIKDCLENAPTVDAVPVVHCRDCRYWKGVGGAWSDGTKFDWGRCRRFAYADGGDGLRTTGGYFCCGGERRCK